MVFGEPEVEAKPTKPSGTKPTLGGKSINIGEIETIDLDKPADIELRAKSIHVSRKELEFKNSLKFFIRR